MSYHSLFSHFLAIGTTRPLRPCQLSEPEAEDGTDSLLTNRPAIHALRTLVFFRTSQAITFYGSIPTLIS